MASINNLMYPPGHKPSSSKKSSENNGKNTYEVVVPVVGNNKLLVSNLDDHKYSLTESKLRILSCCRDLGVSETNEVKYPDLQRAYKLKFNIELGRDELFHLFSNRNATNSLKEGLRSFMHVIEASKTEDNTIRLKLKENSSDYIKELESRYDGPPFLTLTPDQIDSIFNPQRRDNFYQNGRNDNNYQSRGNGAFGRPRFISRNGQGYNFQHRLPPYQYSSQFDPPPQSSFVPNREFYPPPSNNWNNGDNYYRRPYYPQQNYYQNPNFQRPFYAPPYMNNGYNNEPTFEPMAAYVNDQKKQKETDRQRIQYQLKVLKEDYAKLRQDHEDERQRILEEIKDEAEAKLEYLFKRYYEKLGEVEKHAVEENKSIVKEYLKLKSE